MIGSWSILLLVRLLLIRRAKQLLLAAGVAAMAWIALAQTPPAGRCPVPILGPPP